MFESRIIVSSCVLGILFALALGMGGFGQGIYEEYGEDGKQFSEPGAPGLDDYVNGHGGEGATGGEGWYGEDVAAVVGDSLIIVMTGGNGGRGQDGGRGGNGRTAGGDGGRGGGGGIGGRGGHVDLKCGDYCEVTIVAGDAGHGGDGGDGGTGHGTGYAGGEGGPGGGGGRGGDIKFRHGILHGLALETGDGGNAGRGGEGGAGQGGATGGARGQKGFFGGDAGSLLVEPPSFWVYGGTVFGQPGTGSVANGQPGEVVYF